MRLIGSALGAGLLAVAMAACGPSASGRPSGSRQDSNEEGSSRVNIYAATGVNGVGPVAARAKPLVYVPNSRSNTVSVIDPATHKVVRTLPTGRLPQHVVPSYDLSRLWITNDEGNSLTAIDPVTGNVAGRVPVDDPYNLYFSPDGRFALVIAEALHRIDLRDPVTMKLVQSIHVDCSGLDHADFTRDDRYMIATCEFSGQLVKVDLQERRPIGYLKLSRRAMPQDIRSSPDGRVFLVADMTADGVHLIDPDSFTEVGFIKTGAGTHGFVVGRRGEPFYVTNRGWHTVLGGRHGHGSITVLDPETRKILATWPVPDGGSPDMGGLSADGKELWVSGRYDDEVYVFDTQRGTMTARIKVGVEPHGLCVWPQPGRISLGHTGNMR